LRLLQERMNTFLHYIFFLINLPIYFAQTEDCIPLNNSIAINNNATDEWEIYTGAINYAIDISSIPGIINHPIPIQIREWLGVISTSYSAMALYEETALDFFGRPVWSDSLRRCRPVNNAEEVLLKNQAREAFAYSYLWSIQHFIPEWSDSMDLYAHTIGINLSECDDDVNSDCQNEEDPVYLAKLIVTDFIRIFSRDGWNADGSLNADVLLSVGTRNRFPYADWRSKNFNDYRHFNFCDEKWKAQNERCDIPSFLGIEQEDVCWRPPRHEYINLRYYKKQYTIPHIGDTGRSYFFKDSKIVGTLMEYPCHDVENDVRWVINRLNDLNDEKKSETEFFENVWLWMNSFLTQFWNENSPEETSYNKIISVLGTTASMYESTLIIWKEKMRIGFIRPETFVNTNFRGVNFDSYLGPTGKESGLIDGKNWVPFLSGSATGEFPSHGSCMCHAFTLAMQKYSGIENLSPQLSYIFAANSSLIEESMPSSHQNFSWVSMHWLILLLSCWDQISEYIPHFSTLIIFLFTLSHSIE